MTDTLMANDAPAAPTAAETYARRNRRCAMMADWVAGELDAHAERAAAARADAEPTEPVEQTEPARWRRTALDLVALDPAA